MHASLPTVGEIARRLGEPVHRVTYVIQSRQIEPVSVAGNSRVFSESQVAFIAAELKEIDEERGHQCELCNQRRAEHFVDTEWGERHCCPECAVTEAAKKED